jgi:hypothetical protein
MNTPDSSIIGSPGPTNGAVSPMNGTPSPWKAIGRTYKIATAYRFEWTSDFGTVEGFPSRVAA